MKWLLITLLLCVGCHTCKCEENSEKIQLIVDEFKYVDERISDSFKTIERVENKIDNDYEIIYGLRKRVEANAAGIIGLEEKIEPQKLIELKQN